MDRAISDQKIKVAIVLKTEVTNNYDFLFIR